MYSLSTDKNIMLSHTFWCGWGHICDACSFYNMWFGIEFDRYNSGYGGGGYISKPIYN